MKKTLFLLMIFLNVAAFAQTAETKKSDSAKVAEIPTAELIKAKMNMKDVVTSADVKPEFPGGENMFKKTYFENMPTINLKNNEKLDVNLYFIVEKDGYIRNIHAVGKNKKHNEAAEMGIKKIIKRWKPAVKDGKTVRYLMVFPLYARKY